MRKKIIAIILLCGISIELGALASDTVDYCKYKYSKNNINGRIICEIDNLINFSGMASQ